MATYDDPQQLNRDIFAAEEKLRQLRHAREVYNELSEEQQLANYIHGKMCHENHTDGCTWFYDEWIPGTDETVFSRRGNPNSGDRLRYLKKAKEMLREFRHDACIKMIDLLAAR